MLPPGSLSLPLRGVRPPPASLPSRSREAEERHEPGAERTGAERNQIVIKVVAFGDDDGDGDAGARAAPGEAFRRPFALDIVVAAASISGTAVTTDSTVSMPSPTSSAAPSAGEPKRTARPWMRPSAFLGVATPAALAGRRRSSQVRCTPRMAGLLPDSSVPVTAATSAGNRRTAAPSRYRSSG